METSKNICSQYMKELHPCNYCDYKAKQKQRLLVHVDAIHNIVYYSCEVCEIKQDLKRFLENIKVS